MRPVEDQVRRRTDEQVRRQIWQQVEPPVWDQLRWRIGVQIPWQVQDQVWDQVWEQIGEQIWEQSQWGPHGTAQLVEDQRMEDDSRQRGAGSARRGAEEKLEEWIKGRIARKIDDLFASSEDDQLRAAIESEVWRLFGEEIRREAISKSHDSARPAVYSAIYGQQDISWLASCTFLRDHCGIEGMDAMSGMIRVAKSAGWWWPYDELAIITERPALLRNDAQGRLHCADGPALQYPDGFGVWSWHGTQVPSDLIEEGWSVERIFLEPNAEIRRCAIERMGWDVFIQMADLELIASLPDPGNAPHDIALYELPEGLRNIYAEPARILLCVNGTPEPDGTFRRFGLPVPAHHADPLAAAADLYGLTADEYRRAEVRR